MLPLRRWESVTPPPDCVGNASAEMLRGLSALFGYLILLRFQCVQKNKKKKEPALTALLSPCTYRMHCLSQRGTSIPCAIPQPVLSGGRRLASPFCSKGGSHEDGRFATAAHAGNHCQVASDLQFPSSSSLLGPAACVDQQDKP